jgi:hypothetical protein
MTSGSLGSSGRIALRSAHLIWLRDRLLRWILIRTLPWDISLPFMPCCVGMIVRVRVSPVFRHWDVCD